MAEKTESTSEQKLQVFTRESTGLVKNVSFLDSVALNISNMSVGALLGVLGFTFILLPAGFNLGGVNLVYASVLGFLLAIPQVVVYTMMSERFPRTGGDYVYVSRKFGGFLGSTLSFMGYTLETTAYLALIVLSAVFAIGSVGLATGNSGFFGIAVPSFVPGAQPLQQFALGASIFTILILVNIVKPRFGYKLVSGLTIIGIVTLFLAIGTLLAAGHDGVVKYINGAGFKDILGNTFSPITYQSVSTTVTNPGFDWSATLFLMPLIAAFCYPWINAAPAVASEIKGKNAFRWGIPIAAVSTLILLTGSLAALYYVGGQSFVNGALANHNLVDIYGFNFWTLSMGVAGNQALSFTIGFGWIVWNLAILAYGIIVISRYLFAQSFDRFLPAKISYVSPRFGSPVVAHGVDLVLTVALVGAAAVFYGTAESPGTSSLFGAIIASMIYFVFVSLAAVVQGVRKETGSAKTLLTVFGVLNALVFSFFTYEFAAYPGVWGLNSLTYTFVAFSFILGGAIYLASRRYHAKRGIDISLAFKELPPE